MIEEINEEQTNQGEANDEEEKKTETVSEKSDSLITDDKGFDFSDGRPEDFPEEFWDAEGNKPNINELFKAYDQNKRRADGLRVKLSKGEFEGKAPEDIAEYKLELPEDIKTLVPADDPLLTAAKNAAKESGIPVELFSKFVTPIVNEMYTNFMEANKEPTADEIEADRQVEIEKLGPGGNRIVSAVGAYINEMRSTGILSEAEAKTAREMAYSADAVRVLNKLRISSGRSNIPVEVPIDEKSSLNDLERKLATAINAGNESDAAKYTAQINKIKY